MSKIYLFVLDMACGVMIFDKNSQIKKKLILILFYYI